MRRFTRDFGMLKTGHDKEGLLELIEHAMEYVHRSLQHYVGPLTCECRDSAWISHIPWSLPFLRFIPGASKYWDQMKAVGEQAVETRVALGSTSRDLFHHLMDEDGHEAVKPTKALVAVDGQLAIIAGGDTTATTLSHLVYYMLRYPKYLDRLRKEVDETFPDGADSTLDFTKQTNSMPFLNACM